MNASYAEDGDSAGEGGLQRNEESWFYGSKSTKYAPAPMEMLFRRSKLFKENLKQSLYPPSLVMAYSGDKDRIPGMDKCGEFAGSGRYVASSRDLPEQLCTGPPMNKYDLPALLCETENCHLGWLRQGVEGHIGQELIPLFGTMSKFVSNHGHILN
ncbi:hypothetical protein FQN53_006900 [Emmonsiellopsis sp. PD_33]|nr:hypothetical protein FQN53_006900 [Emmonsiellopsis sp. PD_33]